MGTPGVSYPATCLDLTCLDLTQFLLGYELRFREKRGNNRRIVPKKRWKFGGNEQIATPKPSVLTFIIHGEGKPHFSDSAGTGPWFG